MGLKIAQVVAEYGGLAQTGGLADAVAALSKELARQGHDVRVFLPLYGLLDAQDLDLRPEPRMQEIVVPLGAREYTFSVCSLRPAPRGPVVYLIDCPQAYGRAGIYDDAGDEHLRFALLARAALESCQRLGWAPNVLHCHDWHAGLLPLFLQTLYAWDPVFAESRTVLTIHNLAYQGVFPAHCATDFGVPDRRALTHGGGSEAPVNFLAAGIRHAGAVTTVSPTYAREILTAEHGMGLDGLLSERRDRPSGILNGVDYELWNPATDDLIPARYSAADLSGKATCRDALLDELDLDPAPDGPLLGIVSRLAGQKGFELVGEVLPEVLTRGDVRLVVLGTGEDEYEALFERLAEDFPGKVAFRRMFDAALAHRIEAGSDVFLMPSRFEPCGLNQMYSLKYGTPPIVHRIGGLADTVEPFDSESGKGTGFAFEPFGADGFQLALESALEVYRQPDRWHRLMLNGMALDFSWARQVEAYVATYQSVLVDTASVVVSVDGSG